MPSQIPTVFQPTLSSTPPFSVEVKGCPKVEGETIPRRNARFPDKLLTTPEEGVNTLFDLVKYAAAKWGDKKAMGTRKLLKTHEEVKKVKKVVDGEVQEVDKLWTYFELSGYTYLSYIEFEKLTLQIGAGFRKLGLVEKDRVHIFATTSAHWMAIAHGAFSQSMSIVTAYDSLGEEGVRHSLVATKAKAIFLESHLIKILKPSLQQATDLQVIVYNDHDIKQGDIDDLKKTHEHLVVLSFEELRELGEANPVDPVPPKSEDLSCIMYTSGSSGTPKGVILKHKQVIAAVAGGHSIFEGLITNKDIILAYLPLAHIVEIAVEHCAIYWGATLGYGNFRTISSTSTRNCLGDIQELKPTLMFGVPAVWETIKKGIISQIKNSNFIVQNLFWTALAAKKFLLASGLPGSGLLDAVVFSKVKQATGGNLRFVFNGGSAVSKETREFLSMVLTPLINGYGLTETSGMGALGSPLTWTLEGHSDIPACAEVKLVDFPEAGYYSTNNPQQGEIWIRGANVTEEYYQNEAETAAVLTPDGWFKSGDIGEWDKNGNLKVIDRKKNLVKTLNGEYVALEKLESIYSSATVVATICVYASAQENKPIAIIVPAEPALKKLAEEIGVEGHGLEDLAHKPKIQAAVLRQIQGVGKTAKLAGIEMIDAVILADEEWTPQNNFVTATRKLNRRLIFEKYKKDIDKAYKKG